MSELTFRLRLTDTGLQAKLQDVEKEVKKTKEQVEEPANLYVKVEDAEGGVRLIKKSVYEAKQEIKEPMELVLLETDARGKLKMVKWEAEETKEKIEEPAEVKVNAAAALGTIRDLTVAVAGAIAAVKGLGKQLNDLLDSEFTQRRADILADLTFGDMADEMRDLASAMQEVTNYADQEMLPLFAQLAATYRLSADEVKQLMPGLVDFTEANAAAGMNLESAFRMFGRALGGNTTLLKRYGIELDESRLEMEGASYVAEVLAERYGGVAEALVDLRIQNRNTWKDIKEDIGAMLRQIINPVLKGLSAMMKAYQSMTPVLRGFVAGLAIAIPVIVTTTTVIASLTAAVAALKTVIEPVTGTIAAVAAVLVTLGVAAAAATMEVNEAGEAVDDLEGGLEQGLESAQTAANEFNILANRLLDLRSKTNLTADAKRDLAGVIDQLQSRYGDYLGNIDLETAAYDDLRRTLEATSGALVRKAISEVYSKEIGEAVALAARTLTKLQKQYGVRMAEVMIRNPHSMRLRASDFEKYGVGHDPHNRVTTHIEYEPLVGQYLQAMDVVQDLQRQMDEALRYLPEIDLGGGGKKSGGGYTGRVVGNVDQGLREFERLMAEMERLLKTATEQHEEEYERRIGIIEKYTKDETDQRKQAMKALAAWDAQEREKIDEAALELAKRAHEEQISYLQSLESAGVDVYEELKTAMEDYYGWAMEKLPEEEQRLIKARLDQYTGQHADRVAQHEESLFEVRREFADRTLELEGRTYDLQILALELYYERRKKVMLEAGFTEMQIEDQKNDAIKKIEEARYMEAGKGLSQMLGNMMSMLDQSSEREFAVWKGLAYAQAVVDTLAATNAAMSSLSGVNPVLAAAAAAAAFMAGMANAEKIRKMEFKPMAATGGYLVGPSHRRGGIDVEAEGGEYFIARRRVASLGKGLFDFLNFGPIEMVKNALAGLRMPSLPMPPSPSLVYASGGAVQGGGISQMMEAMMAKLDEMGSPVINVTVDPLSNDPVKISRIADKGKKLRSGY